MRIQISRTPKLMDPQSSNFANLPTLASSNFANQTNLESDKKPKRIKVVSRRFRSCHKCGDSFCSKRANLEEPVPDQPFPFPEACLASRAKPANPSPHPSPTSPSNVYSSWQALHFLRRKAPQPDTKPSQLWFALKFCRCLEPLKQKTRKPSLMGCLGGEPSTVVGRDHMLTQARDRSVRPKSAWVVGHPFFNGAGMDPLSAGAGVCHDKKPKRIKVGRSWRAFQILPRVRGILLQQKRKVGRASSAPTVPFPSFQLLGVHHKTLNHKP